LYGSLSHPEFYVVSARCDGVTENVGVEILAWSVSQSVSKSISVAQLSRMLHCAPEATLKSVRFQVTSRTVIGNVSSGQKCRPYQYFNPCIFSLFHVDISAPEFSAPLSCHVIMNQMVPPCTE